VDDLDRLIRRLERLSASARVGALDEENAQKLQWQEFGTPVIPPRPTLSPTTDRLEPAVFRSVQRRVDDVVQGRSSQTGEQVLAGVGADLAEEVRDAIDSNVPPELAESTKASRRRRGKDERTLVDEGDMLRSIRVETRPGERGWADDE
jgi:hypothetical protein